MSTERSIGNFKFGGIEPIGPGDIVSERLKFVPEIVVNTFNEVIARNFQNGEAIISKEEIVDMIKAKLNDDEIFEFNKNKTEWMDVVSLYSSKGWIVEIVSEGKEDYFASPTDRVYYFKPSKT